MHRKRALPILVTCMVLTVQASWNIGIEGDGRLQTTGTAAPRIWLDALGLSVRKTFSDQTADRVIAFALFEARDNFHEHMLHELYVRYKGPLGSWNVTVGRLRLPYGLLTSFATDRFLMQSVLDHTIGFDADNGLLVSGVIGMFDYGLALTQGLGSHHRLEFPGHGLATGRLGITLGDGEELALGLSASGGRAVADHGGMRHTPESRIMSGLDLTWYAGRATLRLEFNAGSFSHRLLLAGFAQTDYALHRRIDLTVAVRGMHQPHHATGDGWFAGLTFKPDWFTLRGGYQYGYHQTPHHRFTVQLYRLFSYSW